MTLQQFLDEAVHQSVIHSKPIMRHNSDDANLFEVLTVLQKTEYDILRGLNLLHTIEPGVVRADTIQKLRQNIVKSIQNFEANRELLPDDMDWQSIEENIKQLNKRFVDLINEKVVNKEALF